MNYHYKCVKSRDLPYHPSAELVIGMIAPRTSILFVHVVFFCLLTNYDAHLDSHPLLEHSGVFFRIDYLPIIGIQDPIVTSADQYTTCDISTESCDQNVKVLWV